jgi:hypothetical protein
MLLNWAVAIVAAVTWGASLFGLLAPFWPVAEFGNHFRPFILAGSLVLLLMALPFGRPGRARLFAAAAISNGALLLTPAFLPLRAAQSGARAAGIFDHLQRVGWQSHLGKRHRISSAERARYRCPSRDGQEAT